MRPTRAAAERILARALFVALILVFIVWAVPMLFNLLSPFIIALPIAAMLQPLIRFLEKKIKLKRGAASFILVLLVCALATTLLIWFISFSIEQVVNALQNAPALVASIADTLRIATEKLLAAAEHMPDSVSQTIRASLDEAIKSLSTTITRYSGSILGGTVTVATGLPYTLIYANFLIMALFFLSTRYDELRSRFKRDREDTEGVSVMRKAAIKGMLGYIKLQLLFAVIHMVFSWAILQACSIPYAALIAIGAALLELIPLFGCGVLYIPWAIIAFIIGNTYAGWVAVALYMVWCLARRITEPKLLSNNIGISPLASLLGMFVGMRLGGVWGLILGPIAMLLLSAAQQARLFDGFTRDVKIMTAFFRERWQVKKQ